MENWILYSKLWNSKCYKHRLFRVETESNTPDVELMLCIFNEFLVHDSRSYERFLVVVAVARAKLEKSTPKCDPDPCLWDAGAVLYKLSNQANWKL